VLKIESEALGHWLSGLMIPCPFQWYWYL